MKNTVLSARDWESKIPNLIVRNSVSQNPKLSMLDMLSRSDVDWAQLSLVEPDLVADLETPIKLFLRVSEIRSQKLTVQSEALYKDQISTQRTKIQNARKDEHLLLPESINFDSLPFLSREELEKLKKFQPRTLGQALRVEGMTPASLVLLHAICKEYTQELRQKQELQS